MSPPRNPAKRTAPRRLPTGPKKPPELAIHLLRWRISGPFAGKDTAGLLQNLGPLRLVESQSYEGVANLLNDAIAAAQAAEDIDRQRPAINEVEDFYAGLKKKVTSLIQHLDVSVDAKEILFPIPKASANWLSSMRQSLQLVAELPQWLRNAEIEAPNLGCAAGRARTRASRPSIYGGNAKSDEANVEKMAKHAVALELLRGVPAILSLLALGAESGTSHYRQRKGKRGGRADIFTLTLFDGLVNCHQQTFGVPPVVLGEGRERNGPSVKWVMLVLRRAVVISRKAPFAGSESIRELSMQSHQTLGGHLQKAVMGIRKKTPNPSP